MVCHGVAAVSKRRPRQLVIERGRMGHQMENGRRPIGADGLAPSSGKKEPAPLLGGNVLARVSYARVVCVTLIHRDDCAFAGRVGR